MRSLAVAGEDGLNLLTDAGGPHMPVRATHGHMVKFILNNLGFCENKTVLGTLSWVRIIYPGLATHPGLASPVQSRGLGPLLGFGTPLSHRVIRDCKDSKSKSHVHLVLQSDHIMIKANSASDIRNRNRYCTWAATCT